MKTKGTEFPQNCLINSYLPGHYTEAIECRYKDQNNITADDIQATFWTDSPKWVQKMFALRNYIVKLFGLRTDNMIDRKQMEQYIRDGKSYGIISFPSRANDENIICLTDKHLTMYLSIKVMNEHAENEKIAIASTIVNFHNTFGRVYFFVIFPFHQIIVRSMLKNTIGKLGGR